MLIVDHGFHNIDQPGERKIVEVLASLRGKMTMLIASDRAIFRDLATRTLEIKVQKIAGVRKEAEIADTRKEAAAA